MQESLHAGYAHPQQVLSMTSMRPLRDDVVTREALRTLLSEHVSSSEVTMVDELEPGTPLALRFQVMDEESGQPLAGVHVQFVQVDAQALVPAQ